jgi:2-oxoglutarate ferredoxin oxidoreductase subunit delta
VSEPHMSEPHMSEPHASETEMSGAGSSEVTVAIKSRGTITIDAAHCKGCELCIPACPPRVLTMSADVNHMGYRYPELYPGCTGCGACLYVCPDFVFEVYRFEQPVVTEVSKGIG